MITFFKWILGLLFASIAAYILFIVVNTMIQEKNKPKNFPCTYISGTCTKKPTYDNCKFFGSVPEHVCEDKLNRKKKL